MLGIVIIVYNIPVEVTILQIEAIRKFCKDKFEINIMDNSSDKDMSEGTSYHCNRLGVKYRRLKSESKDPSISHSFAANISYRILPKYEKYLYLDHDCIPVKEFSCEEILGDKIMCGLEQQKEKVYFWPGLLFWRKDKIDSNLIDFSTAPGLDTGGALWKIIEKYGKENFVFIDEIYAQNIHFSGDSYGYYSLLLNETFVHFINGSAWNTVENNTSRINSLINIVKNKAQV